MKNLVSDNDDSSALSLISLILFFFQIVVFFSQIFINVFFFLKCLIKHSSVVWYDFSHVIYHFSLQTHLLKELKQTSILNFLLLKCRVRSVKKTLNYYFVKISILHYHFLELTACTVSLNVILSHLNVISVVILIKIVLI